MIKPGTSTLEEQIRAANMKHFGSGAIVDDYLGEKYHQTRLDIMVKMLARAMGDSFTAQNRAELKVLELGASTGVLSERLARLGFCVTATDVQIESLDAARRRGLSCLQIDAAGDLPFPDRSYHSVVMGELIEHLFDVRSVLNEIRRVLVSKGVVVLSTPNLATLQDRFLFLFGRSPRQVDALHEYLYLHIRPLTASGLRNALKICGFKDVRIESNFIVLRFRSGARWRCRWLARLFPSLGGSLIASAVCPEKEAISSATGSAA